MQKDKTSSTQPHLDYHSTSFSAGRMEFAWEELSEEERQAAYAAWEAGKGLIGGDPRRRPNADRLPDWGLGHPFFRTLALGDSCSHMLTQLQAELASDRPLEIEIGFGRGDFLLDRALKKSDTFFLGYEVKTKAARLCLARVERFGIDNLWISDDDVRFSMVRLLEDRRIDMIHVLFPDPWWKDQHRVKRLFSPPFVDLLAAKLRSGGLLFFKSDVEEYGAMVSYLLGQHPDFYAHNAALSQRIGDYVPTHREYWCLEHNRSVYSYYFERQ